MLQVTTPGGGDTNSSPVGQLANAAFLAALVLHIWAGGLLLFHSNEAYVQYETL